MLLGLQRISTKYYGSAFSQEEETGVKGPSAVPRSPSGLGSRYIILRLMHSQHPLQAPCNQWAKPVSKAGMQAPQLLWEARRSDSTVVCQAGISEPLPHRCCARPRERTQELKLASAGWKPHLHMTLPPAASWRETANQSTLSPLCQARWGPISNPSPPPSFLRFIFLASFWL